METILTHKGRVQLKQTVSSSDVCFNSTNPCVQLFVFVFVIFLLFDLKLLLFFFIFETMIPLPLTELKYTSVLNRAHFIISVVVNESSESPLYHLSKDKRDQNKTHHRLLGIKGLSLSEQLIWIWILIHGNISFHKNGVLWSQTRMRIEMFFGYIVIGNWQFIIGNL